MVGPVRQRYPRRARPDRRDRHPAHRRGPGTAVSMLGRSARYCRLRIRSTTAASAAARQRPRQHRRPSTRSWRPGSAGVIGQLADQQRNREADARPASSRRTRSTQLQRASPGWRGRTRPAPGWSPDTPRVSPATSLGRPRRMATGTLRQRRHQTVSSRRRSPRRAKKANTGIAQPGRDRPHLRARNVIRPGLTPERPGIAGLARRSTGTVKPSSTPATVAWIPDSRDQCPGRRPPAGPAANQRATRRCTSIREQTPAGSAPGRSATEVDPGGAEHRDHRDRQQVVHHGQRQQKGRRSAEPAGVVEITASTATANAMSVAAATAQPRSAPSPATGRRTPRKISAGATMPPTPPAIGSAARAGSRRSPAT